MIKKFFYTFTLISAFSFAQVGINTEDPKATLHINGNNSNNPDASTGIIIPRVTNNPSSGNEKGQLIFNITDNKFYFWDGSQWAPISSSSGGVTNTIINSSLNGKFADSRGHNPITVTQTDRAEKVIPITNLTFNLSKRTAVSFFSTVSFKGTSSAFSPLFKLKISKTGGGSITGGELIDQTTNTFLSDGISQIMGSLPLMGIKELDPGTYEISVTAYYNSCCSFDFTYSTGGNDTPVSVLVQYH